MQRKSMLDLVVALALCWLTQAAAMAAVEVGGVNFADKAKVGESELALNGAGMRAKFFLKVYAMGLYVPEKKSSAADLIYGKGARRMHIVTLRDLSAEDFAKALVDGIHKNFDDKDFVALKARTEALQQTILSLKAAPKGAQIYLDWLPASGTRLSFNGEKRGDDLPGEDFYQALLRIWLGDYPAAQDLKEALLGKTQ